MSERKFKFVSPGIFIREIDNSQLPKGPGAVGPVIIGRAQRGPAMRPIKVNSYSEFIEIFGGPVSGPGSGDVWRDASGYGPTYAGYAAQAWLRNNNSATIIRLLGAQHQNATTAGKAGWQTSDTDPSATTADNGGSYGLFIVDKEASDERRPGSTTEVNKTGVLAAVLYAEAGTYFTLSGTSPNETYSSGHENSAMQYINSRGNKKFILNIRNDAKGHNKMATINFDQSSPNYIRRVLNTNPTKTNTDITAAGTLNATASYWLGETFDGMVAKHITSTAQYGFIAALHNGSDSGYADHRRGTTPSRTGWVIHQDLTDNTGSFDARDLTKMFRFISRDTGETEQRNFKISIQDIKRSTSLDEPYGTFTVVLRNARDNDNRPEIIERFSNCNLNPNSMNYIARKIGDMHTSWSDTERRLRHRGTYPNNSKYIRVEMNQTIDAGAGNPEHLPFGFVGQPRFVNFAVSGGVGDQYVHRMSEGDETTGVRASLGNSNALSDYTPMIAVSSSVPNIGQGTAETDGVNRIVDAMLSGKIFAASSSAGFLDTFLFPAACLRVSSSDGDPPSKENCYWGVTTTKPGTNIFDESYIDVNRQLGQAFINADGDAPESNASIETSYYFTLDDLQQRGVGAAYVSGSRKAGLSLRGTGVYESCLTGGFDRFTMNLFGGFDGLDITEKEPFRNTYLDATSTAPIERNNYAWYSTKRAIDTVADPEAVEMNLLTVPGLKNEDLTTHMIDVCADRGDALAIIDLKGDYVAAEENTSNFTSRVGDVDTTINNLRARALNSSYGCAYYPWVQVRDPEGGGMIWVPPSVVALGTFASSERRSELWFAPAGFNRGGLTAGSAGLPVVGITERLTAKDRDKLYDANINPIASFPSEGLVIFGQKTLQVTPSALDRINVRRLMIYLKKEISRFANSILFDQNVQSTWNRFLGKVEPFLRSVKTRFGLTDFRVILDETTTTPDLIDRNILYAKIFLKPARAIEFIALDFTITRSGASFDD